MICWLHPPPQNLHHWLQQHLLSEIGQELPVEAQTVFSSEKHWDMEKLLEQGTEIASTWPLLLMSKHSLSWNISKPGCWRENTLRCRRYWVTASNTCAGCSIPYRELILQIRKVAFQPKQYHNYRASYKKPCPCCDSTTQLPRAWLPGLQPHPSAAPATQSSSSMVTVRAQGNHAFWHLGNLIFLISSQYLFDGSALQPCHAKRLPSDRGCSEPSRPHLSAPEGGKPQGARQGPGI